MDILTAKESNWQVCVAIVLHLLLHAFYDHIYTYNTTAIHTCIHVYTICAPYIHLTHV